MTPFATFFPPIRALLGDRLVHGCWNYDDATLASGLVAVFAFGKGPPGYALDNVAPLSAAANVTPTVALGDPFALVCCETALLLVTGEDGGMQVRTRAMLVRDEGHRKRDLLRQLQQECYRIRGGEQVFFAVQNFAAWLGFLEHGGLRSELGVLGMEGFTAFGIEMGWPFCAPPVNLEGLQMPFGLLDF